MEFPFAAVVPLGYAAQFKTDAADDAQRVSPVDSFQMPLFNEKCDREVGAEIVDEVHRSQYLVIL